MEEDKNGVDQEAQRPHRKQPSQPTAEELPGEQASRRLTTSISPTAFVPPKSPIPRSRSFEPTFEAFATPSRSRDYPAIGHSHEWTTAADGLQTDATAVSGAVATPTIVESNSNPNSGLRPTDVICGRGAPTSQHPGNKAYRAIVQQHAKAYLSAIRRDKPIIARRLMDKFQSKGVRFVRRERTSGDNGWEWIPLGERQTYDKICQSLREDAHLWKRRRAAATAAMVTAAERGPTDRQGSESKESYHQQHQYHYLSHPNSNHEPSPCYGPSQPEPMSNHQNHHQRTTTPTEQQQQPNSSDSWHGEEQRYHAFDESFRPEPFLAANGDCEDEESDDAAIDNYFYHRREFAAAPPSIPKEWLAERTTPSTTTDAVATKTMATRRVWKDRSVSHCDINNDDNHRCPARRDGNRNHHHNHNTNYNHHPWYPPRRYGNRNHYDHNHNPNHCSNSSNHEYYTYDDVRVPFYVHLPPHLGGERLFEDHVENNYNEG